MPQVSKPITRLLDEMLLVPPGLPFSSDRVSFTTDLAKRIARDARGHSESQALAFWMRKSEVTRLRQSFESMQSDALFMMPRGLVFHVPPSNVDTLFMYSLVLSILSGNHNIVRMPSRTTEQAQLLLTTLDRGLSEYPEIRRGTNVVAYDHDDATTTAISMASELRVIWGGDATVNRIRRLPIPPHCREITFPDRSSLAAISTSAYLDAKQPDRDQLAMRFYNDTYWFDQMGCSSARLIAWIGGPESELASADFFQRLARVVDAKGYALDAALSMAKLQQTYRSFIDDDVSRVESSSNTLMVLTTRSFPRMRGAFCGGGFFYELYVDSIDELRPHIRRTDQTLAVYGFDRVQIALFLTSICGRGIDRVVSIGEALDFNRYWDGVDLLQEFTRKVTISELRL